MARVKIERGLAVIVAVAGLSACRAAPASASPAALVADQLARGEPLYTQGCATDTCHGARGEGIPEGDSFAAWPLVGTEFQQRNPNAQVVYDAIAYELSLNGVELSDPLIADNAASVFGADMAGSTGNGLYPPPEAMTILPEDSLAELPLIATSADLRLQVDQIASASAIDSASPPAGSRYLMVAFALTNQASHNLDVDPAFLWLETVGGDVLSPEDLPIQSAIARFYAQSIPVGQSIAGLAIFTLPITEHPASLAYDDGSHAAVMVRLAH
jgi:hypothetical protein